MSRTSTTAHAVLGLLAIRPRWSTWALAQELRRNLRFFWPRAESRIYAETRRLEQKGLATAVRSFVGRRPRTEYEITEAGREDARRWMETPPRATSLECEALLRIVLADLGTPADSAAALKRIRDDARAILAVGSTVGPQYLAGTAPFQDQVHTRALLFDFLSHFALTLLDWADRAEPAIAAWPSTDPAARAAAARDRIAQVLELYPAEG